MQNHPNLHTAYYPKVIITPIYGMRDWLKISSVTACRVIVKNLTWNSLPFLVRKMMHKKDVEKNNG
jgi:hypothetical protein